MKKKYLNLSAFCLIIMVLLIAAPVYADSRTCTVRLCFSENQEVYQKIKVPPNTSVCLPVPDPKSYDYSKKNFMGWDTQRGKFRNAKYVPGKSVLIKGNITLYDVSFSVKDDVAEKPVSVPSKYKKVIIVGDSRMKGIYNGVVQRYGMDPLSKVRFLYKTGHGFSWFNDVIGSYKSFNPRSKYKPGAASELYGYLKKDSGNGKNRIAVIIAYGVGDIHGAENSKEVSRAVKRVVKILNALAEDLKKQNVDLYYANIGPGNGRLSKYLQEADIMKYNKGINGQLNNYTIIPLCQMMYQHGFFFNQPADGVHYSVNTSTRMFNLLMNCLQ